jgi:hypothetical protein
MRNRTYPTNRRKPFRILRAQANGLHVRVHRYGHFDRVSTEVWDQYLSTIQAQDARQRRQEGGLL